MIEQNRTLELPGQGIVRDPGPNKKHEEYPKMMTHPAASRGKPDQEIREMDEHGRPTGRLFYRGGEPGRLAPVLVHTLADQEFHASQGYENPTSCSPAAFARLVADAEPVPENYAPIEYPKYVFGKIVNNVAEEEERLLELNINKDGTPREKPDMLPDEAHANLPADVRNAMAIQDIVQQVGAELAEEEEETIEALEAKLAALKAKKAPKDRFVRIPETDTHAAHLEYAPVVEENVTLQSGETVRQPTASQPSDEEVVAQALAEQEAAAKKKARSEAIKAGMARKKAAKAQGDKAA